MTLISNDVPLALYVNMFKDYKECTTARHRAFKIRVMNTQLNECDFSVYNYTMSGFNF